MTYVNNSRYLRNVLLVIVSLITFKPINGFTSEQSYFEKMKKQDAPKSLDPEQNKNNKSKGIKPGRK